MALQTPAYPERALIKLYLYGISSDSFGSVDVALNIDVGDSGFHTMFAQEPTDFSAFNEACTDTLEIHQRLAYG